MLLTASAHGHALRVLRWWEHQILLLDQFRNDCEWLQCLLVFWDLLVVEVGHTVRFQGGASLLTWWTMLVLGGRMLVEHWADILKIVYFLRWLSLSTMNSTWHHDLHGLTNRARSAIRLQKEHLLFHWFEVRAPFEALTLAKWLTVTFGLQDQLFEILKYVLYISRIALDQSMLIVALDLLKRHIARVWTWLIWGGQGLSGETELLLD